MKIFFARVLDFVCFVVGPTMFVANVLDYGRKGYSGDASFFAGIGVGLVAFGILRIYWARTQKKAVTVTWSRTAPA